MPRHQPSDKPDPGEVLRGPVRMRRDAQGRLQVVAPEDEDRKATVEAKPKPPQPDDPRSAATRDVGPGGGFV